MRQNQAAYQPGLWQRTRRMRYTFLAGIIVGIVLGWLLHGVITFILKFVVVAIVLAILVVLFFVWRAFAGREKRKTTVVTWQGLDGPPRPGDGR